MPYILIRDTWIMMFEKDQVSDQKEISCEEISEKLQLNKNTILIFINKNICSAVGKTMPQTASTWLC